MKTEKLIDRFIGDIYFKDSVSLKEDFIHICEALNSEFSLDFKNAEEIQNAMEELFNVFNTNDFIIMADYLQYKLMKKISTMSGSD